MTTSALFPREPAPVRSISATARNTSSTYAASDKKCLDFFFITFSSS